MKHPHTDLLRARWLLALWALAAVAAAQDPARSAADAATPGLLQINAIDIRYAAAAQAQVSDSGFDAAAMRSTLERILAGAMLQDAYSVNSLDIELTDARVRGGSIAATVRVLDPNGKLLRSFALVATGAGADAIYERFAEQVRDRLRDRK